MSILSQHSGFGINQVSTTTIVPPKPAPKTCQVHPGRLHWNKLHLYAWSQTCWDPVRAKAFYLDWKLNIPNFGCSCDRDYETIDSETEFNFSSPIEFFRSSWQRHNAVNKKLERPEYHWIKAKMDWIPEMKAIRDQELQPGREWIVHSHAHPCEHRGGRVGDNIFQCVKHGKCSPNIGVYRPCSTCSDNSTRFAFEPTFDRFGSGERLVVTIGTGDKGKAMLEVARPSLVRYADKCQADYHELTNVTQGYWGLEKFRIHQAFKTYKQVLWVDSDIILRESMPNLFRLRADVAIHDDWAKMPDDRRWLFRERLEVYESQGLGDQGRFNQCCLNTGIVLARQDFADIWKPPVSPLGSFHCAEQILVEKRMFDLRPRLQILEHRFNWQAWFHDFYNGFDQAFGLHAACIPDKISLLKAMVDE